MWEGCNSYSVACGAPSMRTVTAACVPLGRRRIATQQRERQPPCTRRVRKGGVRVAHAVTPPHNDSAPAADDTDTFATLAGKGAVHAPPGHPQSSRYTARCPSIVLCTPCSGVEWRVIEPAQCLGLGKRHDGQAACEPGGGEYGGVPDHPPRLHTTVRPPPKRS